MVVERSTEHVKNMLDWYFPQIFLSFIHIEAFAIWISLSYTWGEGKGNALQYSCLEYPIDGAAW